MNYPAQGASYADLKVSYRGQEIPDASRVRGPFRISADFTPTKPVGKSFEFYSRTGYYESFHDFSLLRFHLEITGIVLVESAGAPGHIDGAMVYFEVAERRTAENKVLRLRQRFEAPIRKDDKAKLAAAVRDALLKVATHELDEAFLVDGYQFTDPHPGEPSEFTRPVGMAL